MEEMFIVTEPKSAAALRTEELVRVYRSRWELENRTEELEARVREQTAAMRELRDRLAKAEFQQREMLKGIARVVDDCDDTLQVESSRVSSADPDDPALRQGRKWSRRVERIRANLAACLDGNGVTLRSPSGLPDPELDRIHSVQVTDAAPAGEIIDVLRPGILWNGAALRCSLVVVAAPPDRPEEGERDN